MIALIAECRQESFFHYLFGVEEEDFFGAIDLRTEQTILFMPKLPDAYAVWMGHIHGPEQKKERYAVDHVFYTEEMPHKLAELDPPALHVLHGINSDRYCTAYPCSSVPGMMNFCQAALCHVW